MSSLHEVEERKQLFIDGITATFAELDRLRSELRLARQGGDPCAQELFLMRDKLKDIRKHLLQEVEAAREHAIMDVAAPTWHEYSAMLVWVSSEIRDLIYLESGQ